MDNINWVDKMNMTKKNQSPIGIVVGLFIGFFLGGLISGRIILGILWGIIACIISIIFYMLGVDKLIKDKSHKNER